MFRYHISTKRCLHRLVVIEYSTMHIMKPKQTFHWIIYKPLTLRREILPVTICYWLCLELPYKKKLSYNINKLNFFILSYKNLFSSLRILNTTVLPKIRICGKSSICFFFYHNSLLKFLKNVSALKATLPVSCLKKYSCCNFHLMASQKTRNSSYDCECPIQVFSLTPKIL